ncbi:GNAT family N-acetyltransferase [Parasulfuritortus cantonensis]|uniref:GNAT family N-acetyltransferase n=1 Tax=Parasulfuritortus cantonensis TaxID=2528202 RepID=A0A4R1B7X5_9PROT|nr:GNAT family N-acetyltransferase [Parasulfuritortus cantonensis]TCJ12808.1 GNAT family N-acetyltransferase [Parasulfuritortus cantonensis]
MKIEVSKLRQDEAEAVAGLAHAVWPVCYAGIISPGQIDYMLEQRYKPALVRQLLARGDLWLAARADVELVGFAHAYPLDNGDYKLDKLYVATDWQRLGIGGELIRATADYARRHGRERLILRVNRQNDKAIKAYLKHGFTVATVVIEDIGDGFVMDDYVMAMALATPAGEPA